MEKIITNTTCEALAKNDKEFWKTQTPEYRLEVVEQLRLEAGKFLYEYPTRFQKVIRITRGK